MRSILMTCVFAMACSPAKGDDEVPVPVTAPVADIELTQSSDCDALRAVVLDSMTEAVLHARYGGIRVDDKLGGKGDDTQVAEDETVELESEPPPVEAEDLVKVVGSNVFIVGDERLDIVAVDDAGQLTSAGYFGVGEGLTAAGMFADEDVAVLFHTIDDDHDTAEFAGTRVTVLNVTDPAQPELARQFDIEGDFEIARREAGSINLVTSSRWRVNREVWDIAYGDTPELPAPEPNAGADRQSELRGSARADVRVRVDSLLTEASSMMPRVRIEGDDAAPLLECDAVWGTQPASSVRLTTVTRFAADLELSSFAVIGDDFAGAVASGSLLAAFSDRWGPFADSSRLHLFDFADGYVTTAKIPGRLVDEFSIAAQDDEVNVITVDGGASLHAFERDGKELVPSEPTALTDGELVVANRITSRAAFVATHGETERIYALPLRESDVSGPFEVGGIPTMIHNLDDDRILVVAQENDDDDEQIGVRIELFGADADPVATASVGTGDFAAWSEAMWEPRSLAYSADGLVAFPVNVEAWAEADGQNFSGVLLYDTANGIERRGTIDHSDLRSAAWCQDNAQPADCEAPETSPWWTHVRRSVFVGERLITISDVGVKSHNVADATEVSQLLFE